MSFDIIGSIESTELIATGRRIRELRRLKRSYGTGRWRKLKGIAKVRFADGSMKRAEVHWYEAHGLGQFEFKVKRLLS